MGHLTLKEIGLGFMTSCKQSISLPTINFKHDILLPTINLEHNLDKSNETSSLVLIFQEFNQQQYSRSSWKYLARFEDVPGEYNNQ